MNNRYAKARRWAHAIGRRGEPHSDRALKLQLATQRAGVARGQTVAIVAGTNDIHVGAAAEAARERTRKAVNEWILSAEAAGYFIAADAESPMFPR